MGMMGMGMGMGMMEMEMEMKKRTGWRRMEIAIESVDTAGISLVFGLSTPHVP